MDEMRIYDLFNCLKIAQFGESQTAVDVINSQIMDLDNPNGEDQQLEVDNGTDQLDEEDEKMLASDEPLEQKQDNIVQPAAEFELD